MIPPFLDSNIFVYTRSSDPRQRQARAIVAVPWQTSVQALSEFALASRRKLKHEWSVINDAIADLLILEHRVHAVTLETHLVALRLAERHQFRFYDAMMIAAALLAGADTFLSEDMHAGLVVDNQLTIVNPFA